MTAGNIGTFAVKEGRQGEVLSVMSEATVFAESRGAAVRSSTT